MKADLGMWPAVWQPQLQQCSSLQPGWQRLKYPQLLANEASSQCNVAMAAIKADRNGKRKRQ